MTKTVVLGTEYDEALREALSDVLSALRAKRKDGSWGVGGSQEVDTLEVDVGGRDLSVRSETYIGLSIAGDVELVDQVEALVKERLRGVH